MMAKTKLDPFGSHPRTNEAFKTLNIVLWANRTVEPNKKFQY